MKNIIVTAFFSAYEIGKKTVCNMVQLAKAGVHAAAAIAAKVASKFNYLLGVNTSGNKKLKHSATRRFIIWNLLSLITCPFATKACADKCYSRKAEVAYPNVIPARERNTEDSLQDDFVPRMLFTIRKIMGGRVWRECPQVVFRIHEAGDFYSQEYADKWLQIMRACRNEFSNLVFVAYTKSVKFFENRKLPANFTLRASVWDDTDPENLDIIERKSYPIYTAAPAPVINCFVKKNHAIICACDNCGTCEKDCFTRKNKRIIVAIH